MPSLDDRIMAALRDILMLDGLPRKHHDTQPVADLLGMAVRIDDTVPVGCIRFKTRYAVYDVPIMGKHTSDHQPGPQDRPQTDAGPAVHNLDNPQGQVLYYWHWGRKRGHIWERLAGGGWYALCGMHRQQVGPNDADPPHCIKCVRRWKRMGCPPVQGPASVSFLEPEGGDTAMGGKPNKGTPADKRLKENKTVPIAPAPKKK